MSMYKPSALLQLTYIRACEEAEAGDAHKIELAKKAIIQKGRDNTRIPIPVSVYSFILFQPSKILKFSSGLKILMADLQHPPSNRGSLLLTVVVSGVMLISKSARTLCGHFTES